MPSRMANDKHIPQWLHPFVALLHNILLAYIISMLCRVAYVAENWQRICAGWHNLDLCEVLSGSLRFDTAALCYILSPYALAMLLPIARRHRKSWQKVAKWLYVVPIAISIIVNLCDAVYSQYTGRRTTGTFFREFGNDSNLGGIVGIELLNHWYLVLIGAALIALAWLLYYNPSRRVSPRVRYRLPQYLVCGMLFVIYIPLCVCGMRGGASRAIRPITISNANQYVNSPAEAAIVLNTPFSIIRTLGKTTFYVPDYFPNSTVAELYTPLHCDSSAVFDKRNVVVLIVESLASEYVGALNNYPGYTPFLDSLIGQSAVWEASYANGRKSIDGMPSILSSIPMFVEPFFVTSYSLNKVSGIAGELQKEGYTTAFFHGAENGSMGFEAYARTSGFKYYYGRTEYNNANKGNDDFDGTWAIWDEPFLQYYARTMSSMQQPFMTAVFTASSHHPFAVPSHYRQMLHEDGHPMYTCIRYADLSLQRFFETARRQPWYDNTLFVITADHTNISERQEYGTDIGCYKVPVVIYDPQGKLPQGVQAGIAQQIDIMPTILGLLGYSHPYIAFGKDLFHTPSDSHWAINYNNGVYQYLYGDMLLQFDGQKTIKLYNVKEDPSFSVNLCGSVQYQQMEQSVKAIIQSYMQRMVGDSLTVKGNL